MKAIFLILLIAIGGYVIYWKLGSGPTLSTAEARHELLRAELATAEKTRGVEQITKAPTSKTAKLSTGHLTSSESVANMTGAPANEPVHVSAEMVTARAHQEVIELRLTELRVIHDRNFQKLTTQRQKLTEELSRAKLNKHLLESKAREFGVKFSQADPDVIIEKHQAQLEQVSAQIAVIEGEVIAIDGRLQALSRRYNDAVAKVMAE